MTTRAPSSRALSSALVSGLAGGKRMALMNRARPTTAGTKLVPKPSGRTTSAAPATPKKTRKSIQERGLRRTCRIFGINNTKAKRAPTARWRSLLPKPSGWERAGLEVVLIFNLSRLQAADFAHAGKSAPHVRNGDGTADDQGNVERVDHFFALPAFFAAANQVIGDAVIASQHRRGDQPE